MWARHLVRQEDVPFFVKDARDYAVSTGAVLRPPQPQSIDQVGHLPITLFPTPFPRRIYEQLLAVEPIFNQLLVKLAGDLTYINQILENTVVHDEFTNKLLLLANQSEKEGIAQPIRSCINRSDYMLDVFEVETGAKSLRPRQVEINTISSGMSSHSSIVTSLHNYLISKYRLRNTFFNQSSYPVNQSLDVVVSGLIDAFDLYTHSNAYLLFVVEPYSCNFSEHLKLELEVRQLRPDIRIVRKPFHDLPGAIKHGPNKELFLDGNKEIAVVYFRYCYDLSHYNEDLWKVRGLLESSRAIKCPSIQFHLVGAKKFQQVLSDPSELEKFLPTRDTIRLCKLFCKFWPLDQSKAGIEGYNEAMVNYEKVVMKPQREGGSHNLFQHDIVKTLESLKPDERGQYILMECINSPKELNWLLTTQDNAQCNSSFFDKNMELLSEIGFYGSVVSRDETIHASRSGGYLVRSKKVGIKENGVASGFAGVGSLILFDDERENDLTQFYNEDLLTFQ